MNDASFVHVIQLAPFAKKISFGRYRSAGLHCFMGSLAPPPCRVAPQVLGRLSEFDGTCVTLLVRGLGLPPPAIEEAFSRLPSDRFAVKQLPPYNPVFGFVADRLMLSWAVRSAEATAFVSTLHTQPLWVSVGCHC